jgi:hypothetical protein
MGGYCCRDIKQRVEALVSFALVIVSFQDFGLLFFFQTLVCNNGLCTSMDVDAGFCNPLSKKNLLKKTPFFRQEKFLHSSDSDLIMQLKHVKMN